MPETGIRSRFGGPLRIVAVLAVLAVLFVGGVFAFATVNDPAPWIGAGFIAAGVALAVALGVL